MYKRSNKSPSIDMYEKPRVLEDVKAAPLPMDDVLVPSPNKVAPMGGERPMTASQLRQVRYKRHVMNHLEKNVMASLEVKPNDLHFNPNRTGNNFIKPRDINPEIQVDDTSSPTPLTKYVNDSVPEPKPVVPLISKSKTAVEVSREPRCNCP